MVSLNRDLTGRYVAAVKARQQALQEQSKTSENTNGGGGGGEGDDGEEQDKTHGNYYVLTAATLPTLCGGFQRVPGRTSLPWRPILLFTPTQ